MLTAIESSIVYLHTSFTSSLSVRFSFSCFQKLDVFSFVYLGNRFAVSQLVLPRLVGNGGSPLGIPMP